MRESKTSLAFACGNTEDESGGIFSYKLDEEDGTLRYSTRTATPNVSFAGVHPDGTHLYTADRVSGGVVTAYRIDRETGQLTRLNRQSSEGTGPCHVSVDASGSYVFVTNFSGGTVATLPIEEGKVGAATDVVEHQGSSIDSDSQREPHPHSIVPGPKNNFVFVPDRGLDRVMIYRIDSDRDQLQPADPPYATVNDGAGPRHFDFHPTDRFAYVINELNSTITAFDYEPETGRLDEIETVSTLPEGYESDNSCADIHVHPSGNWVYGSNRGHDSIALFEIDEVSGRLDPLDYESTRGHWPRNFALDPAGRYLFAENKRSDSIVTFEIDDGSGRLSPTGQRLNLPVPVCLQFAGPE